MEINQENQASNDQATDNVAVQNFLELSDDEIANLSEAEFLNLMAEQGQEEEEEAEPEVTDEGNTEEDPVEDTEDKEEEAPSDVFDEAETTETKEVSEPVEPKEVKETSDEGVYKEVYDRLFNQPIRANNKDLKLNNVDDVIKLVQMGANYNLKMAGIKEQLPYIKMLERNNLLDERELSYLIDLKQGKAEAIARLLKENDIDPYEFDLAQSEGYIPEGRGVSHQEIELEDTIKEISTSNSFLTTMDVIQKVWDDESRELIRQEPSRLRIINEHMESGLFNEVWEEVERNQALGNIPEGVSALQAYDYYGTEMDKLGLLNKYSTEPAAPSAPVSTSTESQEAIKQAKEKALKDKKRAATVTTNPTPSNKGSVKTISPLELSDEEFAKLGDPSLM